MGRPVVHFELWSKNPEQLGTFYSEVFEWNVKADPQLGYRFVDTDASRGINGGITTPKEGPWPGNMALYIEVDDLAAYTAKVEGSGGKTLVERMEIPNLGALGLFEDPDQRVFGIWEIRR
ncbi:MAG TPA: VOC family protein [Thermoanaerobaculia bacterium]|jgi:predicted enzyme related to lactoylglutathione lyase